MNQTLALLFIGLVASLWGMTGAFVTYLYELGFTPAQIVALCSLSAAFLQRESLRKLQILSHRPGISRVFDFCNFK